MSENYAAKWRLPVTSNQNILQEADNLTSGSRNDDYGHPLDDFTKVVGQAKALGLVRDDFTEEDHCIYMVLVKLSRQRNKPKRDNLVDAAGYLRTLEMVEEERERRVADEEHMKETFGPVPR